jgi:putative aminopeptidase FrvX
MNSIDFLKELISTPSPSGFEQPAAALWRKEAAKYSDKVTADVLGNSVAVLNEKGSPRIMLAAHLDEIGFLVKYIDDKGFIFFGPIGGHDATVVVGQRVYIHGEKGPVLGVLGRKAVHLMKQEERGKNVELEDLWIDIGAKDKKDTLKRVQVGDPITFIMGMEKLSDKIYTSHAFDDKMGAYVLIETLKLLKGKKIKAAVFATATTQEETSFAGSRASSFGLDVQVGIAVDVAHAQDYPDASKKARGDFKLGDGPLIGIGANINPRVHQLLFKVAKDKKIPYQREALPGYSGTDASAIQISRAGVATGVVSVPLRYMHTPNEILHLDDLENCAKLLAAFIEASTRDTNWIP